MTRRGTFREVFKGKAHRTLLQSKMKSDPTQPSALHSNCAGASAAISHGFRAFAASVGISSSLFPRLVLLRPSNAQVALHFAGVGGDGIRPNAVLIEHWHKNRADFEQLLAITRKEAGNNGRDSQEKADLARKLGISIATGDEHIEYDTICLN